MPKSNLDMVLEKALAEALEQNDRGLAWAAASMLRWRNPGPGGQVPYDSETQTYPRVQALFDALASLTWTEQIIFKDKFLARWPHWHRIEPAAVTGFKVAEGGKKGGNQTATELRQERHTTRADLQRRFEKLVKDGLQATAARRRLANDSGLSLRQVYRLTARKSDDT